MATLLRGLGGTIGFGEHYVSRNDDGYVNGVSLNSVFGSAGLNFFGKNYDYIAINNNGNVTFSNNSYSGLSTYTPFGLENGGYAIIAPFFADVDTRLTNGSVGPNQVTPTPGGNSRGSDLVWYDLNPSGANGNGILTVTWDDVGYYSYHTDKLNAFQLQIIGKGGGNFDMVFRYEAINWTTGDASSGSGGLGGIVARAGYSTGDGSAWYELPQSGIQNGMLNLENMLGNTGVAGYYKFSVRSGTAAGETINGTSGDDLLAGAGGNDIIKGYAGNDSLIGNAGADRLLGGMGNDIYTIDSLDTVVEYANSGTDTVISRIGYTLGNNLENLQLAGTSNINGTGNSLGNVLSGNSGNNILNGKLGVDTVDYSLANTGIAVSLAINTVQAIGANQGSDTLISIENLIGSYYNDTLTGSAGANKLSGSAGIDTLNGGGGNDTLNGGSESDTLTGGGGNDYFVFNTSLDSSNVDTIKDFSSVADTIRLENNGVFGKLATGNLNAGNFKVGAAAADANDYIIYNNSTGALYYDADGSGSGAAVQFAYVYSTGTTPASLSAADFVVI